MSRPRNTEPCARCHHADVRFATTWAEGRICRRCYQQATRIHGTCASCDTERLLPGLIDGRSACTDCAGIPKDFHCTRCGREDEPVRAGLCAHCCLTDDLTTSSTPAPAPSPRTCNHCSQPSPTRNTPVAHGSG